MKMQEQMTIKDDEINRLNANLFAERERADSVISDLKAQQINICEENIIENREVSAQCDIKLPIEEESLVSEPAENIPTNLIHEI